jgi:hypothetical protein
MASILDAPMTSRRMGKLFDIHRQATDVITHIHRFPTAIAFNSPPVLRLIEKRQGPCIDSSVECFSHGGFSHDQSFGKGVFHV